MIDARAAVWLEGRPFVPGGNLESLLRALRYGDGLFATLRIEKRRLLGAKRHAARLLAGAERLGLAPPEGFEREEVIPARLAAIAAELDASAEGVLRCQWSAEGTSRGYGRGRNSIALVEFSPVPPPRIPSLRVLPDGSVPPATLPGIKSCNAISHVLAANEALRLGVDEVVRVHDGRITECAASNLFFEREGLLLTPADSLPLYPGVVRQRVMEVAAALGIEIVKGEWTPEDLLACDGLILTNSVRGVEFVAGLDDRELGTTPLTRELVSAVRAARQADALPFPEIGP
ncbi:MAG: aminotransferase class IV [marine benthic group bacterium]|jgi:branched-subunit amino acid aminotransferase/4-amino-4-deoxychorismate lyase|nr:aminotransferase class IV [Gemmatimonadota bacterium]